MKPARFTTLKTAGKSTVFSTEKTTVKPHG